MLNHPKPGHPKAFFLYQPCIVHPQRLPMTCSDGRAAIAVSAAALCLAVNWEFYLCGFYVMVCMNGTLRSFEVLCEKQEEGKQMHEYLTAVYQGPGDETRRFKLQLCLLWRSSLNLHFWQLGESCSHWRLGLRETSPARPRKEGLFPDKKEKAFYGLLNPFSLIHWTATAAQIFPIVQEQTSDEDGC